MTEIEKQLQEDLLRLEKNQLELKESVQEVKKIVYLQEKKLHETLKLLKQLSSVFSESAKGTL